MENQISFLTKKSIDSFLMSIEIFNKPTIDYRLEGCVFFLCNAWELLLKAKILDNNQSIYYQDKPDRTLSITDCLNKVFNNDNDPIKANLKVIINLRNTATHYIIPEFEFAYIPFLAFCVKSYSDKLYDFFTINISDYIKTNFLSLFVNNDIPKSSDILTKYGKNISDFFVSKTTELKQYFDCEEGNSIALNVNVNLVRINNKSKADFTFYASNSNTDTNVKYIDRYKDVNISHDLTHHNITNEIDKVIKKGNIPFTPLREPVPTTNNPDPNIFTTACLDIILKEFNLKENTDFCVKIKNGEGYIYKYSQSLITKIVTLIYEDKDIVVKIKKKRLTPGA